MKRTKPSKREIARQLIAQHHKDEEEKVLAQKLQKAREAEANRLRIGPKPPVYLPYVENEMFY